MVLRLESGTPEPRELCSPTWHMHTFLGQPSALSCTHPGPRHLLTLQFWVVTRLPRHPPICSQLPFVLEINPWHTMKVMSRGELASAPGPRPTRPRPVVRRGPPPPRKDQARRESAGWAPRWVLTLFQAFWRVSVFSGHRWCHRPPSPNSRGLDPDASSRSEYTCSVAAWHPSIRPRYSQFAPFTCIKFTPSTNTSTTFDCVCFVHNKNITAPLGTTGWHESLWGRRLVTVG
ncbi:hypothetical protein NDU88_006610 [Pleurodeles waltl]|uniref:Uncharacterized protein n=1 Tax=Pleurodeles waltl TaxID=8319 RepID=A0AAV7LPP9_PLEWA|nr:hypothetical protein NDU88_006610 [Pleurodeles waltl]